MSGPLVLSAPVLGPLTTTFTPPSSCSNTYVFIANPSSAYFDEAPSSYFQAASCFNAYPMDDPSCAPSSLPSVLATADGWFGYSKYSPGLYCPAGHTTACLSARFSNGTESPAPKEMQFSIVNPPVAGETAASCCPSCFEAQDISGASCISFGWAGSITATKLCGTQPSAILTVPPVITSEWTSYGVETYQKDGSNVTTTVASSAAFGTMEQVTVFAPIVAMYWKDSDRLSISTAASSRTSYLSSPVAPNSPQHEGNLRPGTEAAIGVAIAVLILAVVALLMSLLRRRRKGRLGEYQTFGEYRKPELEASNRKGNPAYGGERVELPATEEAKELGKGMPHELAAPLAVHELEATGRSCTDRRNSV
ncbi:hypothetical protein EV356DRAFT_519520 [Viridothelium virens]|uniref:Uncharacterized protein n=1 Tax=Viridothelium virens TaxID=1048519 RepID=A0A6A6GY15_VIRVR|nr:hypothetical protein EV356DRAFT_519520 [Viridothelium virens]